jgi:integrative and conjugative element protein (TIGR02256 family)
LTAARLWLAREALDAMVAEARRTEPLETGGVLLGWHGDDDEEIAVAKVLGPGSRAVHRRSRFSPDTGWQRREIARVYEQSGRTVSYLGDWHSHPGGGETPSRRDQRTARRIARARSARVMRPVMLILPGAGERWRAVPYHYLDGRLERMQLCATAAIASSV